VDGFHSSVQVKQGLRKEEQGAIRE